jgi:hypothetical protein
MIRKSVRRFSLATNAQAFARNHAQIKEQKHSWRAEHDPEKCVAVFRRDKRAGVCAEVMLKSKSKSAHGAQSMIRKSVWRFSGATNA